MLGYGNNQRLVKSGDASVMLDSVYSGTRVNIHRFHPGDASGVPIPLSTVVCTAQRHE